MLNIIKTLAMRNQAFCFNARRVGVVVEEGILHTIDGSFSLQKLNNLASNTRNGITYCTTPIGGTIQLLIVCEISNKII